MQRTAVELISRGRGAKHASRWVRALASARPESSSGRAASRRFQPFFDRALEWRSRISGTVGAGLAEKSARTPWSWV